MYGPNQDRDVYLGAIPVVAAGAATGAIKGVSKILGGILGSGPPYAAAVDRVKKARKDALAGSTTPRSYGGAASKAPVKYLSDIAGLTSSGSRYPEARAAASKALQVIAGSAPEPNKSEAAAAIGGGGTPEAYAAPAPSGLAGIGTPVMLGAAALAAFFLLRKRGR